MDRGVWWAAVHGVTKSRTGLKDLAHGWAPIQQDCGSYEESRSRTQRDGPVKTWEKTAVFTSRRSHPTGTWSSMSSLRNPEGIKAWSLRHPFCERCYAAQAV